MNNMSSGTIVILASLASFTIVACVGIVAQAIERSSKQEATK